MTPARSWRRQLRVGLAGGVSWMAYASGMTGEEKEGKGKRKTWEQNFNGAGTLRQKCREAVTPGRSWRRQLRVGLVSGVSWMAYASGMTGEEKEGKGEGKTQEHSYDVLTLRQEKLRSSDSCKELEKKAQSWTCRQSFKGWPMLLG